ncbi:MAG: hypothetical protein WBD87_10000 [Candidatus Acidiferrales bacterium]
MTEFIRYGLGVALIAAAVLLLWSVVERPKPESKWYWRYISGALGIFLLYQGIHTLFKLG